MSHTYGMFTIADDMIIVDELKGRVQNNINICREELERKHSKIFKEKLKH